MRTVTYDATNSETRELL